MVDIEDLGRMLPRHRRVNWKENTGHEAESSVAFYNRHFSQSPFSLSYSRAQVGGENNFRPEDHPVYFKTFGCAHNRSDSEYMSGFLSEAGFPMTASKAAASIWILNSCTAKTPSEDQLYNLIKEAAIANKKVVVTGCIAQSDSKSAALKGVSLVGVGQIHVIANVVRSTLNGLRVVVVTGKRSIPPSPDMPKLRMNNLIEILAVNVGCLNNCTYCKTKSARGNLVSYPIESLVQQARSAFDEGCKEIWLTSEDLGAWGRDISMVLPDLLDSLVKIIPEGCMMRLGMTNPPYVLDFLEPIAKILNHPRVYSFLHIPVQSGSDAVLSEMKRQYTVDEFRHLVDYMMAAVPNVYIATDFICAYPTETNEDFEDSMKLLREYQFPSVYINQFYPRKGTPAAELRLINTVEARRRTREMSAYFKSYSRYGEERIGEECDVLVCEKAFDGKHLLGRTKSYEQILLPDVPSLLGRVVKVRVTDVSKFHMVGEVVGHLEDDRQQSRDGETMDKTLKVPKKLVVDRSFRLQIGLLAGKGSGLALVVCLLLFVFFSWLMDFALRGASWGVSGAADFGTLRYFLPHDLLLTL